MEIQDIKDRIDESINFGDEDFFRKDIEILVDKVSYNECCKCIAEIFIEKYSSFKSEAIAEYIKIFFGVIPKLALANLPDNYIFKLAVIKGSFEIYRMYMEQGFDIALEESDQGNLLDKLFDLQEFAQNINEIIFSNYYPSIKGQQYNSGVVDDDENEVIINKSDYDTMQNVIEDYNAIIGRSLILKDLEKRIDAL